LCTHAFFPPSFLSFFTFLDSTFAFRSKFPVSSGYASGFFCSYPLCRFADCFVLCRVPPNLSVLFPRTFFSVDRVFCFSPKEAPPFPCLLPISARPGSFPILLDVWTQPLVTWFHVDCSPFPCAHIFFFARPWPGVPCTTLVQPFWNRNQLLVSFSFLGGLLCYFFFLFFFLLL